jgi:hypothetical protein
LYKSDHASSKEKACRNSKKDAIKLFKSRNNHSLILGGSETASNSIFRKGSTNIEITDPTRFRATEEEIEEVAVTPALTKKVTITHPIRVTNEKKKSVVATADGRNCFKITSEVRQKAKHDRPNTGRTISILDAIRLLGL